MVNAILVLIGIVIGVILTLAYQEAEQADRLEAMRGLPRRHP